MGYREGAEAGGVQKRLQRRGARLHPLPLALHPLRLALRLPERLGGTAMRGAAQPGQSRLFRGAQHLV